jgi:DNA primase
MSDLDINDSVLAQLRSAADIVEVVGDHTRLKKAGRSWKGLCPFHNERTPSFTVDRDKGLYHCFGCGAGGDVIHFVRQIDRLDFPEAVESLAERFGVSIPRRARRGPGEDRREKLMEALAAAAPFYAAELSRPRNPASNYLAGRGVSEELARRLGLGYAPAGWDSLSRALEGAFPEVVLVEAGLLQPRAESKGAYDRFRDRLIFVVRDDRGRPVGFGGRALSAESEPKYLNSPESPIFQKKRLLYGLSEARDAIRRKDRVVLVEGYFDHLAVLSAGLDEVVASMGTALTPEQGEKLRRLASSVVLCYDGDSAGKKATRDALKLFLDFGVRVSIAQMPESKDPFDFLRESGSDALAKKIEAAVEFDDWLCEEAALFEVGLSSFDRDRRLLDVLEVLSAMPDATKREELARKVAFKLGVLPEAIWAKMESVRSRSGRRPGTAGNEKVLSGAEDKAPERPVSKMEWRLGQILTGRSELKGLIFKNLDFQWLTDPVIRGLAEKLATEESVSGQSGFRSQISGLSSADLSFFAALAAEESNEPSEPTKEEVIRLLARLEEQFLNRKSQALQQAISHAVSTGVTPSEIDTMIKEKTEVKRRSAELQKVRKGKSLGD